MNWAAVVIAGATIVSLVAAWGIVLDRKRQAALTDVIAAFKESAREAPDFRSQALTEHRAQLDQMFAGMKSSIEDALKAATSDQPATSATGRGGSATPLEEPGGKGTSIFDAATASMMRELAWPSDLPGEAFSLAWPHSERSLVTHVTAVPFVGWTETVGCFAAQNAYSMPLLGFTWTGVRAELRSVGEDRRRLGVAGWRPAMNALDEGLVVDVRDDCLIDAGGGFPIIAGVKR
jgi:hypothetical protein